MWCPSTKVGIEGTPSIVICKAFPPAFYGSHYFQVSRILCYVIFLKRIRKYLLENCSLFFIYWLFLLACEYTKRDLNGYIKTPGYPNPYSHGLNCSWKIIVTAGRKIKLDSQVFDVENSYNCERDALYIYDGSNEKAKLYSRPFCHGNGPKNVVSSSNSLYLRFITDRIDNGKGFLIQYRSFKGAVVEFIEPNASI